MGLEISGPDPVGSCELRELRPAFGRHGAIGRHLTGE